MTFDKIRALIEAASDRERQSILRLLRKDYGIEIHPLEGEWRTTAEAILEAIKQSGDLTQRGIRGILAEATFRTVVVPDLSSWSSLPVQTNDAYDLRLSRGGKDVRIQVKMQRRERGRPKLHRGQPDVYVVETQRTRNGLRRADGGASRPYRRDDFDVLAVCLAPLTESWADFIYCAMCDLRFRSTDPSLLEVLQPFRLDVGPWTRHFDEAADRAGCC